MIQRIQTVYLALASIALIVLYFFPLASYLSELSYSKLYLTHLASLTPGVEPVVKNSVVLPLAIFNGMIALIGSVFVYKKRPLQSKIVKLCILMTIIMIVLVFFVYAPLISRLTATEAVFTDGYGLYLILLAIVMFVLANRAIIKDEKLVRAADRLR
mgnify:CR=1 FL=1